MIIRQLVFTLFVVLPAVSCFAQQWPDSMLAMGNKISDKYISAVSKKSAKASEQIDKQTEKYLAKLEKQEARLKKKLAKIDSLAANNIFANAQQQYQDIQNKVKSKSEKWLQKGGQYFPWLDSASNSLKFLEKNPLMSNLNGEAAKLKGAVSKVKELENQFKQAASVKDFIRQRKEYLKEQLKRYDLGKELKNYNQTAYYYSQQINEYRQALNEPEKAERKVLELLNKSPGFQSFMKKNSMLAGLFAVPQGANVTADAQNVIGLQTRASVEQMLQNQFGTNGPNVQAILQQNIQSSQSMLDMLRDKISHLGGNSDGDLEMPEYRVNQQKTKTFFQRLEYGVNMQTVKSNYFFVTTSDIAASLGYKLNDKNMIGLSVSYKIGLGKDISHIAFSSEGIGFRSFLDMKLKGSFFASGGFEYNFQQPFNSFQQIKYLDNWQRSGLLGVSKIISLKTKFFKKTKLQLLWDFLSYNQRPVAQPLKFRVGYNF